MDKKYLIVSPHSDDALFSCSHVLLGEEYEVQVLTVENDEKRIAEDEKLFGFLGIKFHHLEVEFRDESYYGYNKTYPKGVTSENAAKYLEEYYGQSKLSEISKALVKWVENFLSKHYDYKILSPWGIGHPFHWFVKESLEKKFYCMHYYREFPHSYKRRSQPQVEKQKQEYTLKRSVPVEEFHEVKWKLASKFYKSQSGLLFFENGYIKKELPEEIYTKDSDELPF